MDAHTPICDASEFYEAGDYSSVVVGNAGLLSDLKTLCALRRAPSEGRGSSTLAPARAGSTRHFSAGSLSRNRFCPPRPHARSAFDSCERLTSIADLSNLTSLKSMCASHAHAHAVARACAHQPSLLGRVALLRGPRLPRPRSGPPLTRVRRVHSSSARRTIGNTKLVSTPRFGPNLYRL